MSVNQWHTINELLFQLSMNFCFNYQWVVVSTINGLLFVSSTRLTLSHSGCLHQLAYVLACVLQFSSGYKHYINSSRLETTTITPDCCCWLSQWTQRRLCMAPSRVGCSICDLLSTVMNSPDFTLCMFLYASLSYYYTSPDSSGPTTCFRYIGV